MDSKNRSVIEKYIDRYPHLSALAKDPKNFALNAMSLAIPPGVTGTDMIELTKMMHARGWKNPASAANGKKGGRPKTQTILTWTELVNTYDDDQQLFEAYFCTELGINPDGVFNVDGSVADDAFAVLDRLFARKKFRIRPNHDHIRWRGKLTSDFSIAVVEE